MKTPSHLQFALIPVLLVVFGTNAGAQFGLSEVLADPVGEDLGNQVIEIQNITPKPATLQGFTLFVGGAIVDNKDRLIDFPDLVVPGFGFVKVHWGMYGISTPHDVYTGAGLPALDRDVGSVMLFGDGLELVFDYMQWGGDAHGVLLADLRDEWTIGTWIEPVPEGHTMAYDGHGKLPNDWFEDSTPTLGLKNTFPGEPELKWFGIGCEGTFGVPGIRTDFGPPALGNESFVIEIYDAMPDSVANLGLSPGQAAQPFLGCTVEIDMFQAGFLVPPPVPTSHAGIARQNLPIPHQPTLVGLSVNLQAVVYDEKAPQAFAFTRGLQLEF